MIIKSLELAHFRNYSELNISLHKGINIFCGDNAQGKTNILEAVYLCSTNKSYRGSRDREMIQFGEEEAHIKILTERNELPNRIDLHLKKNRTRGIAVNSVPIRKSSELLGILNVVFFSPEDLQLIKNGPAERRKFMDLELCQLDKLYLYQLTSYNKCLLQRNLLLKDLYFRPQNKETLDVWDAQLVSYGKNMIRMRRSFLEELKPLLCSIHEKLSGGRETLIAMYDPNVAEDEFESALANGRERDLKYKATMYGPHRDDIKFLINGIDIRMYGSQGQQRTAALSLKMAEIEMVKRKIKDSPVLLLDDVLSELDANRQNYLLDSIGEIQTLITCTGLDEFVNHRFHMDQVFRVTEGNVTSITPNRN